MRLIASPLDYCNKIEFMKFYYKHTAKVLPISGSEKFVNFWNDFHYSIREELEK